MSEIFLQKRGALHNTDYTATVRNAPVPTWGAGKTPEEAIGSCLRTARTLPELGFTLTPEQEDLSPTELGKKALHSTMFSDFTFEFRGNNWK